MRARHTKSVAFGIVLVVAGFFLGWGGIGPMTEPRDADGYYMSNPFTVDRQSHAVVTHDMGLLRGRFHTVEEESFIDMFMAKPDDIRMRGVPSGPDALFVGIAATGAIDVYLNGVAHDEITDWDANVANMTDIEYTTHEGAASPEVPATETFWVTSVSGTEPQVLDWMIESGDWTAVIMNADASSGVQADLSLGASPPSGWDALHWISFAVGLVLLIIGGALLYYGFRGRRSSAPLNAE